jgi:hypothetical protein
VNSANSAAEVSRLRELFRAKAEFSLRLPLVKDLPRRYDGVLRRSPGMMLCAR